MVTASASVGVTSEFAVAPCVRIFDMAEVLVKGEVGLNAPQYTVPAADILTDTTICVLWGDIASTMVSVSVSL